MTIAQSPPVVGDESILDEHADELCFTLAMALRRILEIEALDAEEDEDEEGEEEEEEDNGC